MDNRRHIHPDGLFGDTVGLANDAIPSPGMNMEQQSFSGPHLEHLLMNAAAAAAASNPGSPPDMSQLRGTVPPAPQHGHPWMSTFNLAESYSNWYPGTTATHTDYNQASNLFPTTFPGYDDLLASSINPPSNLGQFNPVRSPQFQPGQATNPSHLLSQFEQPSSDHAEIAHSDLYPSRRFSRPGAGVESQSNDGSHISYGSAENDMSATGFRNNFEDITSGQMMYAEAMAQWKSYQGKAYDPFETDLFSKRNKSDLSHPQETMQSQPSQEFSLPCQLQEPLQLAANIESHQAPSSQMQQNQVRSETSKVSIDTQNPVRLSYSDVAKNPKTCISQQPKAQELLAQENLPSEFPGKPPLMKISTRNKSRTARSKRNSRKALKSETDATVKPYSKYGLDMFEEGADGQAQRERAKSQNSESSNSVSRKSSTSSITSGSSGLVEDFTHILFTDAQKQSKPVSKGIDVLASQVGNVATKFNGSPKDLKNHHKFSQGTQSQEIKGVQTFAEYPKRPEEKSPGPDHVGERKVQGKPKKENCQKTNQSASKSFFDPKRIFQTKNVDSLLKPDAKSMDKSSIPNNQQPAATIRRDNADVLNNGKSTASLFSASKAANTTYINNDLGQPKKKKVPTATLR